MEVAKGGFCGSFPRPHERAELHPFCGRLAVTRNCASPAHESEGTPVVTSPPTQGPGGTPQTTTTAAAPAPVPAPDTAILSGPPSQTTARNAVFRFAAQGARSNGFECSVDGGPFDQCQDPRGREDVHLPGSNAHRRHRRRHRPFHGGLCSDHRFGHAVPDIHADRLCAVTAVGEDAR